MIRIAIMGIGGYGQMLDKAIEAASRELDCQLVAAADSRVHDLPDRVANLRDRGVEIFEDSLAMLDAVGDRCDAVFICTSIQSHAPLTIAAFERGLHVHVEKPPAATVQEVDQMLSAAEKAGRMCFVGFHNIHEPSTQLLKERIVSGRLGRIRTLVSRAGWPRDRAYYTRNNWAGTLRDGDAWVLDGPANNALAHQVNNMLYAASDRPAAYATPVAVRGELYAAGPIASHDAAAIAIHTAEGPVAHWIGSHCSEALFGPIVEIEASGGRATWRPGRGVLIEYADGNREEAEAGDPRPAMVVNFLKAIRDGVPDSMRCSLTHARAFVLALNGAHESSGRIHRISSEYTHTEGEGGQRRTIIDGFDATVNEAADRGCLFSDLPDAPPWAVRTEPFDLTGYARFPQRFDTDGD